MPRRTRQCLALLLVASWAIGGILGGEGSYKKCPLDTQTCLDRMAAKLKGRGWLGIEYNDSTEPKNQITRVVPGSPAESAGFKVGDTLESVAGVSFAKNSEEKCSTCEAISEKWKPGQTFTYTVMRAGKQVILKPTLAALPSDVMAQMLGMHMLEHARPIDETPPPAKK